MLILQQFLFQKRPCLSHYFKIFESYVVENLKLLKMAKNRLKSNFT